MRGYLPTNVQRSPILALKLAALFFGFLLHLFLLLLFLVIVDDVEEVVDRPVPLLSSLINRLLELHSGLLFTDSQEQGLLHELDSLLVKLFEISDEHQHQQVDKDISVLADLEESLTSKLLKSLFLILRPLDVSPALLVPALLRVENKLEALLVLMKMVNKVFSLGHIR